MITFKHSEWEKYFTVSPECLSILAVENPATLYRYSCELIRQSEGDAGEFLLLKNFEEELSFSKLCNFDFNVAGLTLNTKKLQTALIKHCAEVATTPEHEYNFRAAMQKLFDGCKSISLATGYSAELNEDYDIAQVFKLFSVAFKENFTTLLEKLIEYVNINIEFAKTKVFVFQFLTKFLSLEELAKFFEHCRYQEVSLILMEDRLLEGLSSSKKLPYQGLMIDNDNFEITKNA